MALSAIEISALRSQGVSEEEIARRNLGELPMATFGGDDLPMGVAGYIGKNPIIDPNMVTPATVMSLDENGPTPALVEANPGVYHDVNDPPLPPREPELPQDTRPVVQQQAEQMQAAAIGGPGYPVSPQDRGLQDPFGSFAAGFAGSQAPEYSGSLQAIASAFGQGSMAMQREMASQRSSLKDTSGMKEYNLAASQGYAGSWMDYKKETSTPLVNIGALGDGRVNVVSSEEKARLGLDPSSEYVVNKQGMPTAIKSTGYTEGQLTASGFHDRMESADKTMKKVTDAGHKPGSVKDWAADRVPLAGNFVKSDKGQQYRQSQEDWVRAKLRKESGAVIADEEMEREIQTYFPQPGDNTPVIEQKKQAREQARMGMAEQSGGKAKFSPVNKEYVPLTTTETDKMSDEEFLEWGASQ